MNGQATFRPAQFLLTNRAFRLYHKPWFMCALCVVRSHLSVMFLGWIPYCPVPAGHCVELALDFNAQLFLYICKHVLRFFFVSDFNCRGSKATSKVHACMEPFATHTVNTTYFKSMPGTIQLVLAFLDRRINDL